MRHTCRPVWSPLGRRWRTPPAAGTCPPPRRLPGWPARLPASACSKKGRQRENSITACTRALWATAPSEPALGASKCARTAGQTWHVAAAPPPSHLYGRCTLAAHPVKSRRQGRPSRGGAAVANSSSSASITCRVAKSSCRVSSYVRVERQCHNTVAAGAMHVLHQRACMPACMPGPLARHVSRGSRVHQRPGCSLQSN